MWIRLNKSMTHISEVIYVRPGDITGIRKIRKYNGKKQKGCEIFIRGMDSTTGIYVDQEPKDILKVIGEEIVVVKREGIK